MSVNEGINIINARYIASAVHVDQYPEGDLAEVAFFGRSNVGKSSLINSLARRGGLARISGTPGKTQTLNFYQLTAKLSEEDRRDFFLVDLPGYGYARTGREAKRQWSQFIDEYLTKSPRLKIIFQLIDIRHAPMDSDIAAYRWLSQKGLRVQVIATKSDKISRGQLQKNLDIIRKGLGMAEGNIIPYSAVKGNGRPELLDVIIRIL